VVNRFGRPLMADEAAVAACDDALLVRVHITGTSTGPELLDGTQVVFRSVVPRRWQRSKSDLCRQWVEDRLTEIEHDGVWHRLPLTSSAINYLASL
jgi:hypothetical protein